MIMIMIMILILNGVISGGQCCPSKIPSAFFHVSPIVVFHVFTKWSDWDHLQEGSSVRWCPPCFPLLYCHCQVSPYYQVTRLRPERLSLTFPPLSLPGVTLWCWVLWQCGERPLPSYLGLILISYFLKQFSKFQISSIQQ